MPQIIQMANQLYGELFVGDNNAIHIFMPDVVVENDCWHGEQSQQIPLGIAQLCTNQDYAIRGAFHQAAQRGFGVFCLAVAHDEVKSKTPAFAFNAVDNGGNKALVFFQSNAMRTELDHHQAETLHLLFDRSGHVAVFLHHALHTAARFSADAFFVVDYKGDRRGRNARDGRNLPDRHA